MKKLESLGRILSKDEQKRIMGGDEEVEFVDDDGGSCGRCSKTSGNTTYLYSCKTGTFSNNGNTYSVCYCPESGGGSCS